MTSLNPADNKKKLSKNVREMKFMQRGALREEKEQQEAEEKQSIDDEHWVLDMAEQPQKKNIYLSEPSYAVCCKLMFGRRSYKGFNPEIEKLCKVMDAESSQLSQHILFDDDDSDHEKCIADDEMAAMYGSLAKTISKRFQKGKKHGRPTDDADYSSDERHSSVKRTKVLKTFLRPSDD